jgi:hypothetical protein
VRFLFYFGIDFRHGAGRFIYLLFIDNFTDLPPPKNAPSRSMTDTSCGSSSRWAEGEEDSFEITGQKVKIHPRKPVCFILYDPSTITDGQRKALRRISNPSGSYAHFGARLNSRGGSRRTGGYNSTKRITSRGRRRQSFSDDYDGKPVVIDLREQADASGLSEFDLLDLQTRDLTPEDFELLCLLDETVQKATLSSTTVQNFKECIVDEPVECGVCLGELDIGELAKLMPCGHKFHPECIRKWLVDYNDSCPFKCSLGKLS